MPDVSRNKVAEIERRMTTSDTSLFLHRPRLPPLIFSCQRRMYTYTCTDTDISTAAYDIVPVMLNANATNGWFNCIRAESCGSVWAAALDEDGGMTSNAKTDPRHNV